jgi:hypothetical protein
MCTHTLSLSLTKAGHAGGTWVRGKPRVMKLMKLKKKGKNYTVFYFAGFFFYLIFMKSLL